MDEPTSNTGDNKPFSQSTNEIGTQPDHSIEHINEIEETQLLPKTETNFDNKLEKLENVGDLKIQDLQREAECVHNSNMVPISMESANVTKLDSSTQTNIKYKNQGPKQSYE